MVSILDRALLYNDLHINTKITFISLNANLFQKLKNIINKIHMNCRQTNNMQPIVATPNVDQLKQHLLTIKKT